MKKVLLYSMFIVILMATSAIRGFAQAAINTDGSLANSSAMLDVSSTTKGLLIPRMSTANRIAILLPAEGLLVYDTDTHSFWFFKSGNWSESLGSTSGWMLNGNSGMDSTSSFLGTTDEQALIIKTNNQERIHVGKTGLIGIGVTNPSHNVHVGGGDVLFQRSISMGDEAYIKLGDGFDAIKIWENPSTTSWSTYISFDWNMNGATHGINWKQNGTLKWRLSVSNPASFTFQSGSGTIMTFTDPDRYVGIGTDNPSNKLHISATNPLRLEGLQANTTDNDVLVSTSAGVIQKRTLTNLVGGSAWSLSGNALTGAELIGSTNNQPVKFYSNNAERMRITEDGKIGIGLINPTYPLQVKDSARFDLHGPDLYTAINVGQGFDAIRIVGGTTHISMSRYIRFSSNFSGAVEGITFDSLGVVKTGIYSNYQSRLWFNDQDLVMNAANHMIGIGTWNPTNKLHIKSTADPLRLEGLQANTTDNDVLVSTSAGVIQKRTLTNLVDGSAWSLSGNALTGTEFLGSTDSHPVKFYSDNSERMRIDENGNIGIGTATPVAHLSVTGNLGSYANILRDLVDYDQFEIFLPDHGLYNGDALINVNPEEGFHFTLGDKEIQIGEPMIIRNGSNDLIITPTYMNLSTKFGVGTSLFTGPSNTLHVAAVSDPLRLEGLLANTTDNDVLVSTSTGVIQKRTMGSLVGGSSWSLSGNALTEIDFLGSTNSQPVKFYSDNSERMRIDENGNVGIGTTSPGAKLEVTDITNDAPEIRLRHDSGAGTGKLSFYTNNTEFANLRKDQGSGEFILESEHPGFPIRFKTPGSTSHFIFDGGNIGVGNTAPSEKIDVTGNIKSSGSVTAMIINASQIVHLTPLATAPASPSQGDMYFDSTTNRLRVWDGTAWQDCW